jgi:hypothetical protein
MLDVTQFVACGLYQWKAGNMSNRDTYEKKVQSVKVHEAPANLVNNTRIYFIFYPHPKRMYEQDNLMTTLD